MVTDHCLFSIIYAWYPRHNSYHYDPWVPWQSTLREHAKYLGCIMRPPLWTLTIPRREGGIFSSLFRAITKLKVNGCLTGNTAPPLCHDMLGGKLGGRRSMVGICLVPPLHPVPILPGEGGVRGKEGFDLSPGCLRPPPPTRLQDCCYLVAEVLEEALVTHVILTRTDSHVDESPCVLQDPHIIPRIPHLEFCYRPEEG